MEIRSVGVLEMPVIAAWNAVVRAWHVAAAWLALQRAVRQGRRGRRVTRSTAIAQLAAITDPKRFVRAAIVPAAGDVALALALLPRRRRDEATITLLACNALRAFDRSAGGGDGATAPGGVTAAVTYLSGELHDPPRIEAHGSDRIETLLAARLPVLRAALEALPGDAGRRCRAMIERVGASMVRARAEHRDGSAQALGEAVVYAARLAAPAVRPPDTVCRAAGCALQIADDLRYAETAERRAWLLSRTLPAASEVARLARWLPVSVGPGTRAAAALLVVTTCAGLLHEAGVALPRRLQRPLRAALAAAGSRSAYLATATAVDGAIRDTLAAHPRLLEGPAIVPARPIAPDPARTTSTIGARASLAIDLVPPRGSDAGELRELTAQIGS
jgi:hypothetical protein